MSKIVLLIDDDVNVQQLVKYSLKQESFKVSISSTGKGGLRKAQSRRPDVIILDIMMPDMSGFDICRTLKEKPDTRNIPIIMLSAKTQEKDKEKAFDLGANHYVTKPFDPIKLAEIAKQAVANRPKRV